MNSKKNSSNWPLVGNEKVVKFLDKSIDSKSISNSYIFSGPDNLGKTTIANFFAKKILCAEFLKGGKNIPCGLCRSCLSLKKTGKLEDNSLKIGDTCGDIAHGDLHIVKKDKARKNISIEQIRSLIRILSMSSFNDGYKVAIIKNADTLSAEASNALLKTLEEPNKKVVIILVTSNIDLILDTVISRSQVLNFYPIKSEEIYDYLISEHGVKRAEAKNFSWMSLGRPAIAVKFAKDKDFWGLYLKVSKIFVNWMQTDNINSKLLDIKEIIASKNSAQENIGLSLKVIEIWQSIVRDIFLFEYGHPDLVRNQIISDDLKELVKKIDSREALCILKMLEGAKDYLSININPKMVFENIAINT